MIQVQKQICFEMVELEKGRCIWYLGVTVSLCLALRQIIKMYDPTQVVMSHEALSFIQLSPYHLKTR